MASPAWVLQEMQPSASQAPASGPLASGPLGGPSTPVAAPSGLGVGTVTPVSKGTGGDVMQQPTQAKFSNAPGYVVPAPSFSYSVPPSPKSASGCSQPSTSSSVIKNSNPPVSPVAVHPPAPGLASSSGPSFSYNIAQPGVGFPGIQQFRSSMAVAPDHMQGGKTAPPSTAASLQPSVPGQSRHPNSYARLNSFAPGTSAPIMPLPVPVPIGASSNASNFSFSGNSQLTQNDQPSKSDTSPAVAQGGNTSYALTISQAVPSSVHTSSSSMMIVSSNPAFGPTTSWMPSTPSFPRPPGLPGAPGTPGPPGLVASPVSALPVADSSSSAVLRPGMLTAPAPANPAVQQQIYPTYPPMPAMAASLQGIWLQPPQMSGMPRPPFLSHPAVYPGPYPLPACGLPLPSVLLSDSQPPGVTLAGNAGTVPMFSAAPGHQSAGTPGAQTEPLQGIDNRKHAQDVCNKDGSAVGEQLVVWTAHKTETGIVYYYNAFTGQSTYEKPPGFKGEPDQIPVQPTPVSMEHLSGTDWALVTTNDGKKYYYNSKTKISSWQIPNEVTDLRKKQDTETSREHSMSVPNTDTVTEKGSTLPSLSAPAINTGGRDATAFRTSGVPGSTSALDLIKKKLQEYGAPATSSSPPVSSGTTASEINGSRAVEVTVKGVQSENSKDKVKDATGDGNMSDSSSDSEDADSGPTKEECIIQFKEMLKERGVAPFSKWEKELPKIVFDPRFKAIPSHSARRSLFEHYVKTRAEEERKEKRAAQKAAIDGFKQLLDEASEDIDHNTDYQTFKKKWGSDPRFEALERKDREYLLNERVLPLKRAAVEKAQAIRAAAASSFKSMLRERGDITVNSRWSRVKDSLRNDPRYKSIKHEDREVLFNEYISELKAVQEEAEREAKSKREEQEKLKERERELRKRKEREEQEMERVRLKVRRKEAVASYQALLVETIKDLQASWTDSKPKLEKDPQCRATNPDLDPSDTEKLFREHMKMLHERCAHDFRALLAEVVTIEAAAQETEDGKTVLNSWSTAKRLLKPDPRYNKMPRKEREALWRRYAEEMLRRHKLVLDQKEEKLTDAKTRRPADSGRPPFGSRRTHEQR